MSGVVLKSERSDHVYGIATINKAQGMVTMYDVRDAVAVLVKQLFPDCADIAFTWGEHIVSFTTGGAAPYTATLQYIHTETAIAFTPA